jgi:hypothetical protein
MWGTGYIYISGVCSLEVEHFNHCLIDIVQNLKSVSVNSTHSICRVLGTRVVYVPWNTLIIIPLI